MKVLHLTTPGHACGVKQYTLSMIDAFPKEPGDEHMILSDAQDALRYLSSGSFDLFHLQWAAGGHSAADLLQINASFCHARRIPFIVTVHNHPVAVLPFQSDHIFVHQAREVAVLIEYGYDARKITKIDQGIPVFPLAAPPEENTFALFGFMLPHKGILEAISALSLLRSRRPDLGARLLLSCAIHPPNGESSFAHSRAVAAHIASLGLNEYVECYTDFVVPESLPDRLQRAKVFLFPYLHGAAQSSSAAVSMAAAMGRPAIVSDLPIFDNLREEGSIVFSPPGAIETLSERMERVLQPGQYQTLQQSARELREQHSWQRVAGEIHAVYESLIGPPPLRVYIPETRKKRIHLTASGNLPFSFSMVLAKIGKALERQGHEITASQIHPYIQNEAQLPFPTGIPDIHVRFCYPPQFEFHAGAKQVLFFCWETTRIPEAWVSPLSQVDHIITFSQFSRAAMEHSGVAMGKVSVVPLGIDHTIFCPQGYREDWRDAAGGFDQVPFVFFHGGALDARKGTADLLRTYMRTFTRDDNTLLVIKNNSHANVYHLPALLAEESRQSSCPARVHLIEREIESVALARMMRAADVGVFPYRAEGGTGLMIMESMGCGTSVMISDFGAPREYVNEASGFLIRGEETASMFLSGQHVEAPNATWYTPDQNHLEAMMRDLYQHPEKVKERKESAQKAVERFTWEKTAKELMQVLS